MWRRATTALRMADWGYSALDSSSAVRTLESSTSAGELHQTRPREPTRLPHDTNRLAQAVSPLEGIFVSDRGDAKEEEADTCCRVSSVRPSSDCPSSK
jgi:hypothetical protein